jgi:HEAT repeat protein
VPIRVSSRKEIELLIGDLSATNPTVRDAAVARLRIIGTRAVDRLIGVVKSTQTTSSRVAALRALEGIADPRALDPALVAVDDRDEAVASAAVAAAHVFLRGTRGTDVVGCLTRVALDPARLQDIRLAAIQALSDLEAGTLKPLWKALAQDANAVVRARAQAAVSRKRALPRNSQALVEAAARGEMSDPVKLRHAIVQADQFTSLALLHQLVERLRDRELAEPLDKRGEWTATRAAAHVALAARGSRLGLYDLRESLESSAALPAECLDALALVGDASCLEAIASAYAKANKSNDSGTSPWQHHLVGIFRQIAKRERITRRHAVVKRIVKRWGDAVTGLMDEST